MTIPPNLKNGAESYINNVLEKLLIHVETDRVGELRNPEVPVTLIYGANFRT